MTPTARARWMHGITAACAWTVVALDLVLSMTGQFDETVTTGHLYGVNPAGWSGAASRVLDEFSYFTVWSNVAVAISATQLARDPNRATPWRKALRLTALLMITVTALVYAIVLAPTTHLTGWSRLSSPLAHVVVPSLTVLGFLLVGPRRWIDRGALARCLAVPAVWVVFMLVRGAVIDAYPYGFADVATHGYPSVLTAVACVLALALVIACLFGALDRLLSRGGRPTP